MADYWHLEPRTGTPLRCNAAAGRCPFGTGNQHFMDPNQAAQTAALKLAEFHEWTSNSVVPQKPGYFTEYVFDPAKPETMFDYGTLVGMGTMLANGTRLVMENGFTLQVMDDIGGTIWLGVESVPGKIIPSMAGFNDSMRVGGVFDEISIWLRIKELGGRLEVPEGVTPIRIKWVPELGGY